MYYRDDREQLSIEEFFLPFGGRLLKSNRWVRLAGMMPWEHIEEIYVQNLSEETGRPAIPSRMTFGAVFINAYDHLTDEGTVQSLQENPYMQYFVGLHEFHAEPLFDPSMMVHFRKRFPVEEIAKINEYVCTGKWPEEQRNVDRNDIRSLGMSRPARVGKLCPNHPRTRRRREGQIRTRPKRRKYARKRIAAS